MLSTCLENDEDGNNDCQYNNSRTYSDFPVIGPNCEQFAVWAERYTVNAFVLIDHDAVNASACSRIGQDTATITASEPGVPSTKKGPNQILAPVLIS